MQYYEYFQYGELFSVKKVAFWRFLLVFGRFSSIKCSLELFLMANAANGVYIINMYMGSHGGDFIYNSQCQLSFRPFRPYHVLDFPNLVQKCVELVGAADKH